MIAHMPPYLISHWISNYHSQISRVRQQIKDQIQQKSQGKPFRSVQRSRILIRRENVTKHGRDIVGLVETEVSPND
jgi:hypothetical protein